MIESYRFGNIVINGVSYSSDIIITGEKVKDKWWRKVGHRLCVEDIEEVIEQEKPDVVVIGTGKYGLMKVQKNTEEFLRKLGIKIHSGKTDDAVRTYNEISIKEKVVGFFHLTC